jgi:hypothetical protein
MVEHIAERAYIPDFTTPEQFIDEKIKILREDFYINITEEDEAYLRSFKRQNEINTAIRGLINKYWG